MSELDQLRQTVEDLQQRVALLESGASVAVELVVAFGITLHEAEILTLLLKRTVITRTACMTVLYGAEADEAPDPKIIDIYVHRLREKVGLETSLVRSVGWCLSGPEKHRVMALVRVRLGAARADKLGVKA